MDDRIEFFLDMKNRDLVRDSLERIPPEKREDYLTKFITYICDQIM